MRQLNGTDLLETLVRQYGVKETIRYYLHQAHGAASRAKVDLSASNTESLAANAQIMISNIEMLHKIISDDKKELK